MNGVAVYLVDDDASFLRAQSRMLRAAGLNVCSYTSPVALLAEISPQTRGCVVTDLSMPGMSGLQLQEALAKAGAELPLVFLTGHADIPSSVHAMREGAVDFLEKCAALENLLAAIRKALARDAEDHEARTRLQALHNRFSRLTPREREVLRHVVRGGMNKQIAATLGISERTVKLHRTAITAKAGVHSPALLATLARDARLFDSEPVECDYRSSPPLLHVSGASPL